MGLQIRSDLFAVDNKVVGGKSINIVDNMQRLLAKQKARDTASKFDVLKEVGLKKTDKKRFQVKHDGKMEELKQRRSTEKFVDRSKTGGVKFKRAKPKMKGRKGAKSFVGRDPGKTKSGSSQTGIMDYFGNGPEEIGNHVGVQAETNKYQQGRGGSRLFCLDQYKESSENFMTRANDLAINLSRNR